MSNNAKTKKGTELLKNNDYEGAYRLYREAAEEGDFYAMYNIACMHLVGDGVEKNEETALEWFIKATDAGDREAASRVGYLYEHGIGSEVNHEKACEYYKKAAEEGSLSGMANYSFALLTGMGTSTNVEEGLKWMNKASDGGNGIASELLGDWYLEGKYVDKDETLACDFYRRGIEQNYKPAVYKLADLVEKGVGVQADPDEAARLRDLAATLRDED